ncbi:MAG: hypothetical protein C0467_32815 [Planctomycetaceae bacterium]|nr:hypothetical protein [Planctomycetaceae bacterium]
MVPVKMRKHQQIQFATGSLFDESVDLAVDVTLRLGTAIIDIEIVGASKHGSCIVGTDIRAPPQAADVEAALANRHLPTSMQE